MIISATQINQNTSSIGSKSKNLATLAHMGICVPDFVVVPSDVIVKIYSDKSSDKAQIQKLLGDDIRQALSTHKYAVRSNALIEDTSTTSLAGQFCTELNVDNDNLNDAINKVIDHAHSYTQGDLSKFSIIVQEYIDAEFAGVAFSRNPLGGHEIVIEYTSGVGQKLVSGQTVPQKFCIYWYEQIEENKTCPTWMCELVNTVKKIESLFESPQDVEWCVKSNKVYILQARPVTTITDATYEQMLFIDSFFADKKRVLYEKTEISEVAPRPCGFLYSLLQRIYAQNGPVANVYRNYGITYNEDYGFLTILGNELYVDRQREAKTLMPNFALNQNMELSFGLRLGIWTTLKNIFWISQIKPDIGRMYSDIQKELVRNMESSDDISYVVDEFMRVYCLIFEINLCAQKAVQNLQTLGLDIEVLDMVEPNLSTEIDLDTSSWLGNSIDIADSSRFRRKVRARSTVSDKDILSKFNIYKRKYAESIIKNAAELMRLREYGRWLTVKYISKIRGMLVAQARDFELFDKSDIYFATVDEICGGSIDSAKLRSRNVIYQKYNKFALPIRLSSKYIPHSKLSMQAVSKGRAEGVMVDRRGLTTSRDRNNKCVLWTESLTPDIVGDFESISAIISSKGGMLSHLAIMAREYAIPVLVNVDLDKLGIKLGDKVRIDTEKNLIEKI